MIIYWIFFYLMLTVKVMIIYKITNLTNCKVYIGLTTRTIQERWKDYIRDYKHCKPGSKTYRPIIAALLKYGLDNFSISILHDNIETMKELDKLEILEISNHSACDPKYGYNVELGGNSIGKHSELTKRKISEAQIGEKNHMYGIKGKDNKSSKRIIDITTGIIYDSVTIATEQLGLDQKSITKIAACARGTRTSAYNHIFRYVDDDDNPIYVDIPLNSKKVLPIIDHTTGKIYNSLKEAAIGLNSNLGYISKILCGRLKNTNYNISRLPETEILVPKYCKVYEFVLEKYRYLINTVPSPEMERCNDYPKRELDLSETLNSEAQPTLTNNVEGEEIV